MNLNFGDLEDRVGVSDHRCSMYGLQPRLAGPAAATCASARPAEDRPPVLPAGVVVLPPRIHLRRLTSRSPVHKLPQLGLCGPTYTRRFRSEKAPAHRAWELRLALRLLIFCAAAAGRFDKDGNGTLEKDELKRAFRALGFTKLEMTDEIFASFDYDGDGRITINEFDANLKPKTREKIEEKLK